MVGLHEVFKEVILFYGRLIRRILFIKKLISVLLSFALTFNIVGQCQTLNASAIEVDQASQQALGQKPCKDPQNISLMAALVTVFISCLELLCCLGLDIENAT